jgi:hypothetical protein
MMLENEKFHWNGSTLHVLGEAFDGDTCWIRSDLMQEIREATPETTDEVMVFIINRTDRGDEVSLVEELVIIPGGDALCYLAPVKEEMH